MEKKRSYIDEDLRQIIEQLAGKKVTSDEAMAYIEKHMPGHASNLKLADLLRRYCNEPENREALDAEFEALEKELESRNA